MNDHVRALYATSSELAYIPSSPEWEGEGSEEEYELSHLARAFGVEQFGTYLPVQEYEQTFCGEFDVTVQSKDARGKYQHVRDGEAIRVSNKEKGVQVQIVMTALDADVDMQQRAGDLDIKLFEDAHGDLFENEDGLVVESIVISPAEPNVAKVQCRIVASARCEIHVSLVDAAGRSDVFGKTVSFITHHNINSFLEHSRAFVIPETPPRSPVRHVPSTPKRTFDDIVAQQHDLQANLEAAVELISEYGPSKRQRHDDAWDSDQDLSSDSYPAAEQSFGWSQDPFYERILAPSMV
eukprot:TRINITY_DN85_c0_g2_i1.p1 TRINITY_DN85_c0_g2~~TRINITY_DN85_c0_g2_i1.p1  ORF type:complete len:340 (+),score=100.69 TRINITY_DN85_c0_g2_i1:137-1021(+)